MSEDLTFTLTEENEKKLYEILYGVDVNKTSRFWVKDKRGYSAFYEKVIHCKDCKHWDGYYCHNKWWGDGYGNYTSPIKTEEGFCDWAERKEE